MAEIRGRPFAFVTLTLVLWTSARMAWPETELAENIFIPRKKALPQRPATPTFRDRTLAMQSVGLAQPQQKLLPLPLLKPPPKSQLPKLRQIRHIFHPKQHGLPPALVPWQVGGRPSGLPMPLRVAGDGKSLSAGRDTPPTIAHALAGKAGPPEYLRQKRWQIYAYSFWRASGSSNGTLGPNAQYGGSQSGVIATHDPFGDSGNGVALLARAAVTPDGEEREVAMGLRWKPDKDWPLHLTGEYRLRANAPDVFAAYLSGGVNAVPLVANWSFDAFGQAGYASGKSGGAFFDAHARVMRPLAKVGGVPLSIGAGSWGGGQRGAVRLDIGPMVAAKIDTGPAVVLIQLDWRLRVAGNAEPKNGLALTLSTGF